MYFSNFPKFTYSFPSPTGGETGGRSIVMADIFRSVKISKETLNDVAAFEEYVLEDGDRPEDIANKYYGDTKYYWLVLLSNDIIDVSSEWGLSTLESQERLDNYYSGYAFYFNEEMDIQPGDYVVKVDASLLASEPGVSQEYGIVDRYLPTLNKIECRIHNFNSLTTGASSTTSLDAFYVFRKNKTNDYTTLTSGFEATDYLTPKRIDDMKNSILYFKSGDTILNPSHKLQASTLVKNTLLYATNGKKDSTRTLVRAYHTGSDLKSTGVEIVTYQTQIRDNFLVGGKVIKLLRKEFLSFAENQLKSLLDDNAKPIPTKFTNRNY